jgi:WD40 repeat protein
MKEDLLISEPFMLLCRGGFIGVRRIVWFGVCGILWVLASSQGTLIAGNEPEKPTSKTEPILSLNHVFCPLSIAFTPDGKSILVAEEFIVKVWNVASGKAIARFMRPKGGQGIRSIAISPDGKTFAVTGHHRPAELWNLATRKRIATFEGSTPHSRHVQFSPNGKLLAATFRRSTADFLNHTLTLWEIGTGKVRFTKQDPKEHYWVVAFSPDGKLLAAAGQGTVIWDVETGVERYRFPDASAASIAFSPDGKTLAFGALVKHERFVILRDLATGKTKHTLAEHKRVVFSVAFSPNGKLLAAGGRDKTINVWDVTTGKLKLTLRGHTDMVNCVAFSPDGKLLATASDDRTIKLWAVGKYRGVSGPE